MGWDVSSRQARRSLDPDLVLVVDFDVVIFKASPAGWFVVEMEDWRECHDITTCRNQVRWHLASVQHKTS